MKIPNYRGYVDQIRELENHVDAKDPFNSGVRKAIESSKASLGLSRDQEHKAIRKGINTFSARLSEKFGNPFMRKKGFVDNLASVAPAASAGLEAYDDAEDEIKHDNQKVIEWTKKFIDDERKRLYELDKEGYNRYYDAKKLELEQQKLDEQRDYHQSQLTSANQKETPFDKKHKLGMEGLNRTINEAFNTINRNKALAEETGNDSEGEAGFIKRTVNNNWLAHKSGVSLPLTPKQQEIATLGSLLAGYGNKLMNFTNQVEFESLPHIDPYNSDDANLAILKKMQDIMIRDAEEHGSIGGSGAYNNPSSTTIPASFTPRKVNVDEYFDEDDYGDL